MATVAAGVTANAQRPAKRLAALQESDLLRRQTDEAAFRASVVAWQKEVQRNIEQLSIAIARMDVMWQVMEPREREDTRKLIRAVLPATYKEERNDDGA